MFAHFLANKPTGTKCSGGVVRNPLLNNNSQQMSSKENNYYNYNGRPSEGVGGASRSGFWSVWNLLPSSILKTTTSSSKSYYKDKSHPNRYQDEQQRHTLIDRNGQPPREIEMDFLNHSPPETSQFEEINSLPTPPMSPSMFILPRCMDQEQCYSPVKLMAVPPTKRRFQFRSDDCESLIEKFDRITIMEMKMVTSNNIDMNGQEVKEDQEAMEKVRISRRRMKSVLFDLSS